MRVAINLQARNANTIKMRALLPLIEAILMCAAKHKYRPIADMNAAYEQLQVIPEHVPRTMVATPDGNMDSEVMQIGDVNAATSWQTFMNHEFSAYIGVFMDVYLDDIIIYSDSVEEHVKHIRMVFQTLHQAQLYMTKKKVHLFTDEL